MVVDMVERMVGMGTKPKIGFVELATKTGLPAQTLRRYAKEFAPWLPTSRAGRAIQFQAEAVEVVETIRAAFEQGKTTPEVRDILGKTVPATINLDFDQPQDAPAIPASGGDQVALAGMLERIAVAMERQAQTNELMADQRRQLDALAQENADLRERVARLESLVNAPALDAARTPQEAPKPEIRPEGQADDKTAGKAPFWLSLLRIFGGGDRGE